MPKNLTTAQRKNKHLIAGLIVVMILIALALMQSLAGAMQSSVNVNIPDTKKTPVTETTSTTTDTSTVTVLIEAKQKVAGFFNTNVPQQKNSVTTEKITNVVTVKKTLNTAQTIRSFFSVVGKPKEGQVLAYINGRLEWHDLTYVAQNDQSTNGSVHVSGFGRKPLTYPINGSQALHSAAGGGVSPERHYGGGGGNPTSTTAGTTTIVNNYTTNTTSGSGSGSATFVGTTPVTTYTGLFTSGAKTGYDAANTICAAAFTSSHMCRTDEILDTIATKDISTLFIGIADAWIAEGPPGFTADSNDCRGWTSANLSHLGPWWDFSTSGGGIGYLTNCSTTKPIACCKVQ